MKEYTSEEIAAIKASLPQDLQRALASVDLMNELASIVKEKRLHVDQAGTLADIVELTLAGLLHTREFIRTLGEELPELSQDERLGLAEQVSKRIFAKVQTSLKQIDQAESTRLSEGVVVGGEGAEVSGNTTPASPLSSGEVGGAPKEQGMAGVVLPTIPIHDMKTAAAVSSPSSVRDVSHVNTNPALKMIPDDMKAHVNNDPYKEPI